MKKTILFYSALLLTAGGFAQTTVHSQQTTSSATTVQTDAAAKANARARAEMAAKKEVAAGKAEEVRATGKTTMEKVAQTEVAAEASGYSHSNVNAGENRAQVDANGSLNTGTTVSLSKVNDHALEVKKEVAARLENKTNAGLQKSAEVKSTVQTKVTGVTRQTGAAAASKGTKVAGVAKAKPTTIKVKTNVNAAAGVKLR